MWNCTVNYTLVYSFRSAWAQCQTRGMFQIPGDTVIVCVKICNSVPVWIMYSTIFCDASLLPVILQSPQSLMPACCQSSYRVHNLWCQPVASHPTESTIFDASLLQVSIHSTICYDAKLLPVITQCPQSSVMPACCQSSYRVHRLLWCRLFAGLHTETKIFCDASLLPVTQSPQSAVMPACCHSSYRVHNLLWCQLVASHHTESAMFFWCHSLGVIIYNDNILY